MNELIFLFKLRINGNEYITNHIIVFHKSINLPHNSREKMFEP